MPNQKTHWTITSSVSPKLDGTGVTRNRHNPETTTTDTCRVERLVLGGDGSGRRRRRTTVGIGDRTRGHSNRDGSKETPSVSSLRNSVGADHLTPGRSGEGLV